MKKLITIMLMLTMMLGVSACAKETAPAETEETTDVVEEVTEEASQTEPRDVLDGTKWIVIERINECTDCGDLELPSFEKGEFWWEFKDGLLTQHFKGEEHIGPYEVNNEGTEDQYIYAPLEIEEATQPVGITAPFEINGDTLTVRNQYFGNPIYTLIMERDNG